MPYSVDINLIDGRLSVKRNGNSSLAVLLTKHWQCCAFKGSKLYVYSFIDPTRFSQEIK